MNTNMISTVGKGSMFDAQSSSQGAASGVKQYATDGSGAIVVPGTNIKMIDVPEIAKGEYDGSDDYRQFRQDRATWVNRVVKAGGRVIDCWSLLREAGHMVTVQTLYADNSSYNSGGLSTRAKASPEEGRPEVQLVTDREPPEPTVDLEEIASAGRAHADTISGLSTLIDHAVERMELELRIEIEELTPKAKKWEQLRKIRELLPK